MSPQMVTGAGTERSVCSRLKIAPHSFKIRKATSSSKRPSRRKWARRRSLFGEEEEDEDEEEYEEEEEIESLPYTSLIPSRLDAGGGM